MGNSNRIEADMGAAAAAIAARKQRDIVTAYRDRGATSPAQARSPEDVGIDRGMIFRGLVDRAVLRESGEGRYYLDEPSWEAHLRARRRMALVVLLIALVLFIALFASRVFTRGNAGG